MAERVSPAPMAEREVAAESVSNRALPVTEDPISEEAISLDAEAEPPVQEKAADCREPDPSSRLPQLKLAISEEPSPDPIVPEPPKSVAKRLHSVTMPALCDLTLRRRSSPPKLPAIRLRSVTMPVLVEPVRAPRSRGAPSTPLSGNATPGSPQDTDVLRALAARTALARETTSVVGVPTLRELMVARTEARARDVAARQREADLRPVAPVRSTRESPVLFPGTTDPGAMAQADERAREESWVNFAYGALAGSLAVGLSVFAALLFQ